MSHEPRNDADRPRPAQRRSPEWLAFLCIAMGVLLVPGVCLFNMSDPKLHQYFGFSMLMAVVVAIVLLVAGVTMARRAADAVVPDRLIVASPRPLTPLQRGANWGAVLFIILVLVLAFIFRH